VTNLFICHKKERFRYEVDFVNQKETSSLSFEISLFKLNLKCGESQFSSAALVRKAAASEDVRL
jgi:hypothetical protein